LPSQKNIKIIITICVLAAAAFFILVNLGHYPLWDDEATTALYAQSVWRTGDTHAILDHNLVAYNSGAELENLRNRYIPPLGFYLAAPFVGLGGATSWYARLPFAICGLLTIAFILFWLWKSSASLKTWYLMSAGILGNVSLMLYARQCRYYAPTILATTILAFLYIYRDSRKRTFFAIIITSLILFSANYMSYVAAYACILVDYLIWGRKTRPIKYSELAIIFIPQIILGGLLFSLYNPIGKNIFNYTSSSWLSDKIMLFFLNLREFNGCELGVGILIILAPILYHRTKDKRMLQVPMAMLTYIFVVSILTPPIFRLAYVRYLAPLIPLAIFTAVLSIKALTVRQKWLAIPIAVLAFGTNILHGGPLTRTDTGLAFSRVLSVGRFRSTVIDFTRELISPPPSAYRETADWINQNVEDKESIWVTPGIATYPLMYHAPKAIYAWQIITPSEQFLNLDDIHFFGRMPPEYIIAFGPHVENANRLLSEVKKRNINYVLVKQINRYWYDLIRPELSWHSFFEIKSFSLKTEAIYIFEQD